MAGMLNKALKAIKYGTAGFVLGKPMVKPADPKRGTGTDIPAEKNRVKPKMPKLRTSLKPKPPLSSEGGKLTKALVPWLKNKGKIKAEDGTWVPRDYYKK